MPTIDTLHPDAATSRVADHAGSPPGIAAVSTQATAVLSAFRAGRSEAERTSDLLAFAIATERELAPTPDAIERARREAEAALGDYSLRHLHNSVDQIRHEAVLAHLGGMRPPPGFLKLVGANLVACVAIAGAAAWVWSRPDVRAALARLLGI